MSKNDIQQIMDQVQSWRDESDNHTIFCLFGDRNRDDGYEYNSSVGGEQRIVGHMIYTEMKRDKVIAEAVKKAVEVYDKEEG